MRTDNDVRSCMEDAAHERLHLSKSMHVHFGRIFVARLPFKHGKRGRNNCSAGHYQLKKGASLWRVEIDLVPHAITTLTASVVVSQNGLTVFLRLAQWQERRAKRRRVFHSIYPGANS